MLQIVVLNTNLWTNDRHAEKAMAQWKWLEGVFKKLEKKKLVKVGRSNNSEYLVMYLRAWKTIW